MIVVHESPDLLVIRSHATVAKVVYGCMVVFGGVLCLGAAVSAVVGLMQGSTSDMVLFLCFFGGGGLLFAVPGAIGYHRAEDSDYHFTGKKRRLIVRRRHGETVIPFSRIVAAEVFDGGTDSTAYGLRLQLRGTPREMEMSQHPTKEDVSLHAMATRINRFLTLHE
jgi:hypothetical protein